MATAVVDQGVDKKFAHKVVGQEYILMDKAEHKVLAADHRAPVIDHKLAADHRLAVAHTGQGHYKQPVVSRALAYSKL